MHVRRICALAALALGCARELDLPSTAPLSVTPAFASLAPRETLTLAAAGGTGGYKFAFAEGGQLSGKDATVDAATGAYQAGALGSAQDVLVISDSSGAAVQARVTVGQKLFLTPSTLQIAPGGRTQFSATGGKPPYSFDLSGGTASMTLGGKTGVFFAGTDGDANAQIVVRDQTGDPKARDTAQVAVGAALKLFAPGKDALTPWGTLDLIATGGQPPYAFTLGGNSGGSVALATGHYQAGPAGGPGVQDVVTVTDAYDQSASLTLTPGPPLSLRITSQDLHPGLGVSVVAAGGKPPYSFAFDPRGNRSNGQGDAITGLYTPGGNFGATDVIVVRDSTPGGLASASATGTAIGPQRWSDLRAFRRFAADLDGDGRADLVSVTPYPIDPVGMLETRLTPANGPPIVAQYHYAKLYDAFAADLNGDGHADLFLVQDAGARIVYANPDGSLGGGTQIAARVNNPNDRVVLTSGTETGKVSFFYTDYTSGNCVARVDAALATGAVTTTACAAS
ncbi:MAG: FG-GAP repeat domain-containing protein, partial [Myxococcales bacterium]